MTALAPLGVAPLAGVGQQPAQQAAALPVYDWHKLHRARWHSDPDIAKNLAATMAHPARFARDLIRAIYADARAKGFAQPGCLAFDPFCGTGLGGLDAMAHGLHWHGIEIEAHHWATAVANLANWAERYSQAVAGWGTAKAIHGDSRDAAALLPAEAMGNIGLVVTSPPYGDVIRKSGDGPGIRHDLARAQAGSKSWRKQVSDRTYGNADGQLDALPVGSHSECRPGTFWGEAAAVVRACHSVMAPGGVAYWNVRDYVRAGQVVPLGQQWQAMCQANGFAPLYVVRSWLVTHKGTQYRVTGGTDDLAVAYKSQPRRVSEKKGAPPIDWEWVIVMRRLPGAV